MKKLEINFDEGNKTKQVVDLVRIESENYKMIILKKQIRFYSNEPNIKPLIFNNLEQLYNALIEKK